VRGILPAVADEEVKVRQRPHPCMRCPCELKSPPREGFPYTPGLKPQR
jgi:hypothetical protein